MPRYIDLDKIPHLSGLLSMEDGLLVSIGDVRKALELARVEDVPAVAHGRCKLCKDGKTILGATHSLENDGEWHKIKYCPNCGKRIGFGENEEIRDAEIY